MDIVRCFYCNRFSIGWFVTINAYKFIHIKVKTDIQLLINIIHKYTHIQLIINKSLALLLYNLPEICK